MTLWLAPPSRSSAGPAATAGPKDGSLLQRLLLSHGPPFWAIPARHDLTEVCVWLAEPPPRDLLAAPHALTEGWREWGSVSSFQLQVLSGELCLPPRLRKWRILQTLERGTQARQAKEIKLYNYIIPFPLSSQWSQLLLVLTIKAIRKDFHMLPS